MTVHNLGAEPATVDVPVDPDGAGLEAVDLMAEEVVTREASTRSPSPLRLPLVPGASRG